MTNDNPFDGDELPPGASVFGDVAPQVGASVFGTDDLAPSHSVFADVDAEVPLETVPADAIESRSASVFGNVESPIGFDDSPTISPVSGVSDNDDEEFTLDLRSGNSPDGGNQIDAGSSDLETADLGTADLDTADPESAELESAMEGRDPMDSEDDDFEDVAPSTGHSFDDGIEPGEPIALDVDPDDDDGLQAWSDLSSSAPALDAEDDVALDAPSDVGFVTEQDEADHFEEDQFDDGHLDDDHLDAEPEVVQIQSSGPDGFFEFDDTSPDLAAARSIPDAEVAPGANSDLQPRVITGAALLAVAIIAFAVSPILALILIVVMVTVASGELFNALRVAGYQPATLLGLAASIAMPLAVYFRGTQAVALILGLTIVFGLIWYIAGVATEMPVMNLGVTVLGVAYVGGLASFGAAMLENARRSELVNDDGTELLLIALVLTISYDIGAYFSGRSMGRTPLTAISPNKTVEGLLGGVALTVVTSVVFVSLLGTFVSPINDFVSLPQAVILGVAAAIMAPLGDLAESLIKRDLGIKDMGTILPGHGGVLDRIDALLFVLPTVYFFALAFVYAT